MFWASFQELRAQGRSDVRDEQLLVMLAALTYRPRVWAVQLSALLQVRRRATALSYRKLLQGLMLSLMSGALCQCILDNVGGSVPSS